MKKLLIPLFLVASLCLSACGVDPVEWRIPEPESSPICIDPLITRVKGASFERDDQIGLTITNPEGDYCENQLLTYDGSYFMADGLVWYNDVSQKADLVAYYPYSASGSPISFTVLTDQSASGYTQSDLLVAVANGVVPSSDPVSMTFHHLMSKIVIELTNNSDHKITSVLLGGSRPMADVDLLAQRAVVSAAAPAVNIIPFPKQPGALYEAIVVPQQVAFTLIISTDDGKVHPYTMVSTELSASKLYTLSVTLTNIDLHVSLRAEIEDWVSGGEIAEQEPSEEESDDVNDSVINRLNYAGEEYAIATMADQRVWMVENLRYTPSAEHTPTSGIFYPGEGLSSESDLMAYGLLYTAAAALGVEEITTQNYQLLEGTRGVCPEGWHIPTKQEAQTLYDAYPDAQPFSFITPTYWNGTKSAYVENSAAVGMLRTSTPYSTTKSWVMLFYADGSSSFDELNNANGYPVRCLKDQN